MMEPESSVQMTVWFSSAAAIIAAFILGVVSLTVTTIAKEQKVSEFRLAWIDAFRVDIAEYISLCFDYVSISNNMTCDDKEPKEKVLFESGSANLNPNILAFNSSEARIKLRLNWDEHTEIMATISQISKWRSKYKNGTATKLDLEDLVEVLLSDSNKIISYEWKRVKKGEFLNRVIISAGRIIVTVSLSAALTAGILYKVIT
ncbi:hypothetical protein [Shewanella sp. 10N.286.54.B9]|uniref:hypothetical protein n=1 Tax=Shewanella sp. 10N.286.54.B9 TaxID=3229719 RepID=UPI0035531185